MKSLKYYVAVLCIGFLSTAYSAGYADAYYQRTRALTKVNNISEAIANLKEAGKLYYNKQNEAAFLLTKNRIKQLENRTSKLARYQGDVNEMPHNGNGKISISLIFLQNKEIL